MGGFGHNLLYSPVDFSRFCREQFLIRISHASRCWAVGQLLSRENNWTLCCWYLPLVTRKGRPAWSLNCGHARIWNKTLPREGPAGVAAIGPHSYSGGFKGIGPRSAVFASRIRSTPQPGQSLAILLRLANGALGFSLKRSN
jgi:hypothetical protein